MRVAICQVDGKWPNLALAKIAAWHRDEGDVIEWFNALDTYDAVYASKVFADTPENLYLPLDAVRGGTGWDCRSHLAWWTEGRRPDFSLWPHWHKSMGFTTRGCVRRCPFCVVPEKEGPLRVVAEFGDVWDGRSREVVLLDNNLTAAPLGHFRAVMHDAHLAHVGLKTRGYDARLWTAEHAAIVAEAAVERRQRFAFDSMDQEMAVRRAITLCMVAGLRADDLTFYVLIGFNTTEEEDLYRIGVLRGLGVNPFVMPYDRHDAYQRRFARWVNQPVVFKSMTWLEWLATFKTPLPVGR